MSDDLPRHTPRNEAHDYDIAICRKLDRMNGHLDIIRWQLMSVCIGIGAIIGLGLAS